MDRVQLLLDTYLFQDVPRGRLETLAAGCRIRELAKEERVYRLGEPARELFVVVSGQLKESVVSGAGEEMIFELLGTGAVFGEPALYTPDRLRAVDVVAMERSLLLVIERNLLLGFLLENPPAMLRALEGLATQVVTAVDDVTVVAYLEIRRRLLAKILELVQTHGEPHAAGVQVSLRLTQATLAGMIGASRENVNRVLAPLLAAGEIRFDKNHLLLRDRRFLDSEAAELPVPRYRRNRHRPHREQ